MAGRLAMFEDEAELLADVVSACPGDHVEIGCLWGGTALIAALAKPTGNVVTVDPMAGGWWKTQDPMVGRPPTPAAVLDNFARFGVAHRVSVVKALSAPWPLPADYTPDTILIDGDHERAAVALDWQNAAKVARRYILMHDYGDTHPGVKAAIDAVAMQDPGWYASRWVNSLIVFERRENDESAASVDNRTDDEPARPVEAGADEHPEPDLPKRRGRRNQ